MYILISSLCMFGLTVYDQKFPSMSLCNLQLRSFLVIPTVTTLKDMEQMIIKIQPSLKQCLGYESIQTVKLMTDTLTLVIKVPDLPFFCLMTLLISCDTDDDGMTWNHSLDDGHSSREQRDVYPISQGQQSLSIVKCVFWGSVQPQMTTLPHSLCKKSTSWTFQLIVVLCDAGDARKLTLKTYCKSILEEIGFRPQVCVVVRRKMYIIISELPRDGSLEVCRTESDTKKTPCVARLFLAVNEADVLHGLLQIGNELKH